MRSPEILPTHKDTLSGLVSSHLPMWQWLHFPKGKWWGLATSPSAAVKSHMGVTGVGLILDLSAIRATVESIEGASKAKKGGGPSIGS